MAGRNRSNDNSKWRLLYYFFYKVSMLDFPGPGVLCTLYSDTSQEMGHGTQFKDLREMFDCILSYSEPPASG